MMSTTKLQFDLAEVGQSMQRPEVTIVVVPRERFSFTQANLESIYSCTSIPFKLIYVDGNSPDDECNYLRKMATDKQFHLIRTEKYLSPNCARNIGLQHVETDYLVFIDNDVIVTPGWLTALMGCAKETGATVVGPLTCEGNPFHHKVHFAGGESHVVSDVQGRRLIREKMYRQGQTVTDARPKLKRTKTELAEFHCVLVQKRIFDQIGPLDEKMLNTKEHLDFCMTVREAGGEVYFEPDCLITYVPGSPLKITDMHFYMLRWSDEWTLKSLHHFRDKWDLHENGYFLSKYRKLGWRRRQTIVQPLSSRIKPQLLFRITRKSLTILDKFANRLITHRYFSLLEQSKKTVSVKKY